MSKLENYIEYFSASTINLFVRDKSKFILKVAGYDDFNGNPSTLRGNAVENQLLSVPFYKEKNIQEHIDDALAFYSSELLGLNQKFDEKKIEKERADIPHYVMSGFPTYYNIDDEPIKMQSKVELNIDGLKLPIIGYIDLECERSIRDLKTTRAIPSALPHSVNRQLAIYSTATNKDAWVDYASKKHCTTYRVSNIQNTMDEIVAICQGIEKFLSISENIKEIAPIHYPNLDSWEWGQDDINNAKKLWSIK